MSKSIYRLLMLPLPIIIFLAGCATVKAPLSADKQWTPTPSDQKKYATDTNWESIRLGQSKELKIYSLAELVDIALQNNPSTKQAWESAKKAEAQKGVADSAWAPAINAAGTVNRERFDSNLTADSYNQTAFSSGGSLTFLALDFGGRNATIEQALQSLISANYSFNQSFQDLYQNVQTAYYTLHSAEADLLAKRADLDSARMAMNASRQKFQAGLVSKLDVYQTQSSFYQSSFNLEASKYFVKTARSGLAQILALSADTKLEIVPPPRDVSTGLTKLNVSKLIDKGLERRPDVAAKRASLKAKEAAVWAADSALWPSATVQSTGTKDWFKFFNASKHAGNDVDYFGQLKVNWTVFDGYSNLNKKIAAEADRNAERQGLILAELAASKDVWDKYYQFKAAIRQNRFSRANLTASDASYRLALEGYRSGLKNILDLLKAQSDLSGARSSLVQSQRDLYVARAQLIHALGAISSGEQEWMTELN